MGKTVLISGAGIAGPTLAYWLCQSGFTPSLIERAPALRTGGYIMDFWGVGFDVAERMQLLPRLRQVAHDVRALRIVDRRGRPVAGFGTARVGHVLRRRYFSILRGELVSQIHAALDGRIETLFGDGIRALHEDEAGIDVEFDHAAGRRFDLVIGADGLHSAVRRLVFGPEARHETYLGYCAASFTADGYPHRDPDIYIAYCEPGKQVARFSLRDGRTVFFLVFALDEKPAVDRHDSAGQRGIVDRLLAGAGWECREILRMLDRSGQLYFDAVSQIRLDAWHRGRIALIGDAAFCPSLLAGEGSSLAMASAYVLAGELQRASGDFRVAYPAYQGLLKRFIDRKQRQAAAFARKFAPRTGFGLAARNALSRLLDVPLVGDLMVRQMFADRLELPEYGSPHRAQPWERR
ncbi:MAG TPA: FAD-binding domain [Stellaceae bacterium]|nr:FAD-binding domain [Stellaceae bacterium]